MQKLNSTTWPLATAAEGAAAAAAGSGLAGSGWGRHHHCVPGFHRRGAAIFLMVFGLPFLIIGVALFFSGLLQLHKAATVSDAGLALFTAAFARLPARAWNDRRAGRQDEIAELPVIGRQSDGMMQGKICLCRRQARPCPFTELHMAQKDVFLLRGGSADGGKRRRLCFCGDAKLEQFKGFGGILRFRRRGFCLRRRKCHEHAGPLPGNHQTLFPQARDRLAHHMPGCTETGHQIRFGRQSGSGRIDPRQDLGPQRLSQIQQGLPVCGEQEYGISLPVRHGHRRVTGYQILPRASAGCRSDNAFQLRQI